MRAGKDADPNPSAGGAQRSVRASNTAGTDTDRALTRLLPGLRAEELIATGRLILGLTLLLAVSRSDELPRTDVLGANALLIAFSAYALTVLAGVHLAHDRILRYTWVMHAVDLMTFAGLLLLTGGSRSEYFTPLFFPIVSGAIRWPNHGAMRAGAFALVVFVGAGIYDQRAGTLDVDAWLVRTAALVAIVLLLAQMGRVGTRHAAQVLRLTRWPRIDAASLADLAGKLLERAATVLGAGRALLVVEDPEEPWLHIFSWQDGAVSHERRPAAPEPGPEGPRVHDAPFLLKGRGPRRSVLYLSPRGPRLEAAPPMADWLARHLESATVVGLPLRGESATGHLFLLNPPDVTADDLRLAELVARHVVDSLERFILARELQSMTAARERARVSRDLHDGILQTFSGVALKLAAVRRLLPTPDKAREELQGLEQLVLDEQRDLRLFTEELGFTANAAMGMAAFPASVGALIQRLEKIWSVAVEWDPDAAASIPPKAAPEVYQLLREAIVNAARHGHASHIRLRLSESNRGLHITVADNGGGFPFHGRFTLTELIAEKRGPRSLRERVHQLAGELFISSSSEGAHIEIVIPTAELQAWR